MIFSIYENKKKTIIFSDSSMIISSNWNAYAHNIQIITLLQGCKNIQKIPKMHTTFKSR